MTHTFISIMCPVQSGILIRKESRSPTVSRFSRRLVAVVQLVEGLCKMVEHDACDGRIVPLPKVDLTAVHRRLVAF